MTRAVYAYLNRPTFPDGTVPFFSKLISELEKAQRRAPAGQWLSFIKGLTTKGVKGAEIAESGVIQHLESLVGTDAKDPITREDLVQWLLSHTPTVKEMDLLQSQYKAYSQPRYPADVYRESLYLLNSERDNVDDRIADIRFELEELDFDLEALHADPLRAINLHNELNSLKVRREYANGVRFGHWSSVKDDATGEQVSNMVAHARVSMRGDLFFIEEIQSDWAQRGRLSEWRTIPEGPWVTNTESWAGLILRRQIQRAAQGGHNRIAWITGSMRNGGDGARQSRDGLDDFYLKILPKIADKLISGTGMKTRMIQLDLGGRQVEVPGFDINDAVREKMSAAQPLYSRDIVPAQDPVKMNHELYASLTRALQSAEEMLGSSVQIRLAAKVFDAATGEQVAGSQLGHLIQVSLSGRDPVLALSHEVWHYAHEHLLDVIDQASVDAAFAPGSRLNDRVRETLVRIKAAPGALQQCDDSKEAAAHGFALWKAGQLTLSDAEAAKSEPLGDDIIDRTAGRLFRAVEAAFERMTSWVRRVLGESPTSKAESRVGELFTKLREGMMKQTDIVPIDDYPVEEFQPQRYRQRA
ncbi:hypothetical protein [Achromobacter anxifer]|uniref:hypothetical protein n=1 Tax=Achromobacter anxifer TaxID=1287737 RepID=UPI0023FA2BCA|nr:hypothetical protein [Achromobacter anxifer]MDF8359443.1 hypothetical protein [Achromobacter anxifer]